MAKRTRRELDPQKGEEFAGLPDLAAPPMSFEDLEPGNEQMVLPVGNQNFLTIQSMHVKAGKTTPKQSRERGSNAVFGLKGVARPFCSAAMDISTRRTAKGFCWV
jgi:hypothetical protein